MEKIRILSLDGEGNACGGSCDGARADLRLDDAGMEHHP